VRKLSNLDDGVEGERRTGLFLFLARHEVHAGHLHERRVGREPNLVIWTSSGLLKLSLATIESSSHFLPLALYLINYSLQTWETMVETRDKEVQLYTVVPTIL
jgi:hypothetical protein